MRKIMAIIFIFISTTAAWILLGGTITMRTNQTHKKLRTQVSELWGEPLTQHAPRISFINKSNQNYWNEKAKKHFSRKITSRIPQRLCGSDLDVEVKSDLRKKGLLWYSTYIVNFKGTYCIQNQTNVKKKMHVSMQLPSYNGIFDNVDVIESKKEGSHTTSKPSLSSKKSKPQSQFELTSNNSISFARTLLPGQKKWFTITYSSRGLDQWKYSFGKGIQRVENFKLNLSTNFSKYDFPSRSMSPNHKKKAKNGWLLTWKFKRLLSGSTVGVRTPKPLDPGSFATRVTFNAPVGLFFFFFVLWLITTIRKTPLSSMHYFFLSCSCFSFHLLMAYTADILPLTTSFVLSAIVSIFLVLSYTRLLLGWRWALLAGGLNQLIYIILFSAAFFLQGVTGLTITILSIITLFLVMQSTAKVEWEELFGDDESEKSKSAPKSEKKTQI